MTIVDTIHNAIFRIVLGLVLAFLAMVYGVIMYSVIYLAVMLYTILIGSLM